MQKEPATIISSVVALITEVVGLLVAFGIDVSQAQQTAIIATVTALSGVIALVGPIIRGFVFSPASVEKISGESYAAGVPPTDPVPPVPEPADREDVVTEALDALERASKPQ